MEEQLLDFIKSLKAGKGGKGIESYDEAKTKQAIILRCLHILGWDTFDVDEIHPEYSVGRDRVDYSLRLDGANKVFLEAKKVSEDLEKHQKQLLNYSFQQGVKLAILSNGITWWFYLPLHEGDWEQRKFYSIDIYQQEAEDVASKFIDFLSRENIVSGLALDNAKAIYKSQQRQKILQATLPKAWNIIISEPDSLLVDLINETSESICGYRADDRTIKRFLSKYGNQLTISADTSEVALSIPSKQLQTPQEKQQPITDDYTGKKISSFWFHGSAYAVQSWRDLLLKLCDIIHSKHEEDFHNILAVKGKTRSYFTRDKSELTDPKKIPNTDIFVESNQSAQSTIRVCRLVAAKFGYSGDALKIEVDRSQDMPMARDAISQVLSYMTDTKMKQMAIELLDKIGEWDRENIRIKAFKHCISLFISRRVFAVLTPRKKFLNISAYIKDDDWQRIRIQSAEELEKMIPLIKNSYEKLKQQLV